MPSVLSITAAPSIIVNSTAPAAIVVASETFPLPSKLTAPAVTSPVKSKSLAVAKVVAVVALPLNAPSKVVATIVCEPSSFTVHLSFVSSHINDTFVSVPLSISIPPSCEGVPVSSALSTKVLSPMLTVFESI